MIKVNALLFLFVIEFLVVSVALTLFMFLRYRKRGGFGSGIGRLLGGLKNEADKCKQRLSTLEGSKEAGKLLEKEMIEARLSLIDSAVGALGSKEADSVMFWDAIYEGFNGISGRFLRKMQGLVNDRKKALEEVESMADESEKKIAELNTVISSQKNQITQMEGYRDMLDLLQAKFAESQEINANLAAELEILVPEAERSDELQKMVADFERNIKEMNTCVNVLEGENKRLGKKTHDIEGEVERLSHVVKESVSYEKYERVLFENDRLKEAIAELESQLKEKSESYERLQQNLETLENEYTALYEKQKEMEQQG